MQQVSDMLKRSPLSSSFLEASFRSTASAMTAALELQQDLIHSSRHAAMATVKTQEELGRILTKCDARNRALASALVSDSIVAETQKWRDLLDACKGPMAQSMAVAAANWTISIGTMADMVVSSGLCASKPLLSRRLIEPGIYLSSFSRASVVRMARCNDDRKRRALSASVRAADDDGTHATIGLAAILDIPEGPDDESPTPRMNIAHLRRQELEGSLIVVPEDADLDYVLKVTRAGRLANQTRRMLDLILECNQAAALGNREKIFKTTDKMLEGFAHLPFQAATNRANFSYVVGTLYCMLYEGAGSMSLRFMGSGLLSDEECRIIWAIKHLRNKYLSHDIECGSPDDIRGSWRSLRESLEWLGILRLPQTKDDFVALQERLIEGVICMLEMLLHRISALPAMGA